MLAFMLLKRSALDSVDTSQTMDRCGQYSLALVEHAWPLHTRSGSIYIGHPNCTGTGWILVCIPFRVDWATRHLVGSKVCGVGEMLGVRQPAAAFVAQAHGLEGGGLLPPLGVGKFDHQGDLRVAQSRFAVMGFHGIFSLAPLAKLDKPAACIRTPPLTGPNALTDEDMPCRLETTTLTPL